MYGELLLVFLGENEAGDFVSAFVVVEDERAGDVLSLPVERVGENSLAVAVLCKFDTGIDVGEIVGGNGVLELLDLCVCVLQRGRGIVAGFLKFVPVVIVRIFQVGHGLVECFFRILHGGLGCFDLVGVGNLLRFGLAGEDIGERRGVRALVFGGVAVLLGKGVLEVEEVLSGAVLHDVDDLGKAVGHIHEVDGVRVAGDADVQSFGREVDDIASEGGFDVRELRLAPEGISGIGDGEAPAGFLVAAVGVDARVVVIRVLLLLFGLGDDGLVFRLRFRVVLKLDRVIDREDGLRGFVRLDGVGGLRVRDGGGILIGVAVFFELIVGLRLDSRVRFRRFRLFCLVLDDTGDVTLREFLRRGYDVRIGRIKEKEVDFVCEREFSALMSVHDQYPKMVLTLDRVDFSSNGIRHRYLPDFLMEP